MIRERRRQGRQIPGLLLVALLSLVVVACGDDEGDNSTAAGADRANQAFLEAMTPHHLSAVEMAEIAEERAEHPETRRLAREIVSAQRREIELMAAMHERLFDTELQPNGAAYRDLGLTAEQAGAGGHPDLAELRRAEPFDREFIDMMVPHHQGAIRMARAVLAQTDDAEVRGLAEDIVEAQALEIREMNEWRTAWYGGSSPAGGVPAASGDAGPEDGGEHGQEEQGEDAAHGG